MSTNFDFNASPWYDDYNDDVGQHGDHNRILFKPGKAVQARELTQLQTIQQKQIERLGEHIFDQGSSVVGGNQTYNRLADYVKVESQYNDVDITVSNFDDTVVAGTTSLARANVYHTEALTTDDPNTMYLRYHSGDQNISLQLTGTITNTFLPGETITGTKSGQLGVIHRWDSTNKILWITRNTTASIITGTASAGAGGAEPASTITLVGTSSVDDAYNNAKIEITSVVLGTASAGASSTITLVGTSSVNDTYNNAEIEITGGTGSGQTRTISDYVGSTLVATVSVAWATTPDSTSTYRIAYAGTGAGQHRTIGDYVGSTKVATVYPAWITTPDSTSTYRIVHSTNAYIAGETVTATTANGTDSLSNASGALAATLFQMDSSTFGDGETLVTDIPKLTFTVTPTGTFKIGDMVTGSSSSATGQVVTFDSAEKTMRIIAVTDTFEVGETVESVATGGGFKVSGTASAVISTVTNLTADFNATVGGGSTSSISASTGTGMLYSIDTGIYFTNGFFAKAAAQTIVVKKYGYIGKFRVGLVMTESTDDSNDDASLLDNAQGSSNENAPGADRYKITLTLTTIDDSATSGDEKFIQLARIVNGNVQKLANHPIYSELGKSLAKRTFDESGNYTVNDFRLHFENNAKDTEKVTAVLGPGKAYIHGFEYETIAPTKLDVDRARTNASVVSGDTVMQLGNYTFMDSVQGVTTGDFFDVTTHECLDLHCVLNTNITLTTDQTYLRTLIGTARVRGFGHGSADPSDTSDAGSEDYKIFLYDFKFHSLLGTAQSGTSTTMVLEDLEDNTNDAYNGATVEIIDGTGSGQSRVIYDYVATAGPEVRTITVGTAWATTPDSTSVYRISFTAKNIQSIVKSTSYDVDTAPVVLQAQGDIAIAGRYGGVAREAIYKTTKIDGNAHGDTKLFDTDFNTLVYPIGESNIKAIDSDGVEYEFQKKFTNQTFSGGTLTISTTANEEFYTGSSALSDTLKNSEYLVIHKSGVVGSTSLVAGNLIDWTAAGRTITPNESAGTVVFDINDGSYVGVVDILARKKATGAGANAKTKTLSSNVTITNVEVNTNNNNLASLGYSDVDSISSILDIGNSSAEVVASFVLENGQKDNYYDHSKIRKKNDGVTIAGPLTVVFKHYAHSGDGYFSVNSYSGINYGNITQYISPSSGRIYKLADCVDFRPSRPNESGTDHREFKTTHGEAGAGGAGTITLQNSTVLSSATLNSYADTQITLTDGTGKGQVRRIVSNTAATPTVATVDSPWDINPVSGTKYVISDSEFVPNGKEVPYPNSNWNADYDYYLSRVDTIYFDKIGSIKVWKGTPEINPKETRPLKEFMPLYSIYVPAYTNNFTDITIKSYDNKRYDMKDIGKLETRIENLEYYTSLSLLEQAADALNVKDTAGIDRFKNGILVDNFTGHGVGDVKSEDYQCSIDFERQDLRPKFNSDHVDLSSAYDSTLSTGVTKTGDLITLSYTTKAFVSQLQATQGLNLNPFLVMRYLGTLILDPPVDTWIDTTTRPDIIDNTDDNDAWKIVGTTGFGTQWGDWQTFATTFSTSGPPGTVWTDLSHGNISRIVSENQTRIGIKTFLHTETVRADTFTSSIIPYIRAKSITVSAFGMKPNTRVYPFFDGNNVSNVCTPLSPSPGSDGDPLYTDGNGSATIIFLLPAATYKTGNRVFTLIDNISNDVFNASTKAEASYHASGVLHTFDSTRVYSIKTQTITQDRVVESTQFGVKGGGFSFEDGADGYIPDDDSEPAFGVTGDMADALGIFGDPDSPDSAGGGWDMSRPQSIDLGLDGSGSLSSDSVAQTFFVSAAEYPRGLFLANIDIYMKAKDDEGIPVSISIREVLNGHPTPKIIPFSEKWLNPNEVNITATGPQSDSSVTSLTATKFTFDSPVFLPPGEYAMVLFSASKKYETWIAEIGEIREDVTGTRRVTKQPYTGSLFLSQNDSTWTPHQWQDLTFILNKCLFTTASSSARLQTTASANTAIFSNSSNTPSSTLRYDTLFLGSRGLNDGSVTNTVWAHRTRKLSAGDGTANIPSATTFTNIVSNDNIDIIDGQRIITATAGSWIGQATLTSINVDVSPVIDVKQLFLIPIENLINNFTTDETNSYATLPDGDHPYAEIGASAGAFDTIAGGARARYITRRVQLADGFDAQDLTLYITADKPPSATITIYYKVLSNEDDTEFDTRGWTAMQLVTSSDQTSGYNSGELLEYEYETVTSPIVYINPDSGISYTTFKNFAIKIVMTSSDTNFVPKIQDLRVIAIDRGRA